MPQSDLPQEYSLILKISIRRLAEGKKMCECKMCWMNNQHGRRNESQGFSFFYDESTIDKRNVFYVSLPALLVLPRDCSTLNVLLVQAVFKMVSVGKCCLCFRLSTGGIILGSFGAFSSLLLIIIIGGFLLSYDNFVTQSYEKGANGDTDNKKLAMFLETYKKGERELFK